MATGESGLTSVGVSSSQILYINYNLPSTVSAIPDPSVSSNLYISYSILVARQTIYQPTQEIQKIIYDTITIPESTVSLLFDGNTYTEFAKPTDIPYAWPKLVPISDMLAFLGGVTKYGEVNKEVKIYGKDLYVFENDTGKVLVVIPVASNAKFDIVDEVGNVVATMTTGYVAVLKDRWKIVSNKYFDVLYLVV